MISRPHLGIGSRIFWPTVLVALLLVKAAISLVPRHNVALDSYGAISYFLLLLVSTTLAIRNATQRTNAARTFWIFIAAGYGLWAFDQWLYVYYGVVLHTGVPDSSVADPALFLHIVPLMAAVALQPHFHRPDQKPSRATLDFLLLLFFWVFLYAYALFPYQYLFANEAIYDSRFTASYAIENGVLVLALGILALRSQTPWKSVYFNFFGASALYAVSSTLANIAIDSGGRYNGTIYSFAQTASVCWFVWLPVHARQLATSKVRPIEPDAGLHGFISLVAKIAVIAIPLIGMLELFRIDEPSRMRTFRLSVVLVFLLLLTVGVFLKEHFAKRDLVLDSQQSKLQEKLSVAALVKSEDRYRDLVEHSQDLLCTHDLDGNLLSCSPAAARVLGYEVAELLKIPMREFMAPKYRDRFADYLNRIKANGADRGLIAVVTRTGETRIWEYDNTLHAEGVPTPVVRGMARDITARKQAERALRESEAELREAQRVALMGSWRFDVKTQTVTASEQLYHVLGQKPTRAGIPFSELPKFFPPKSWRLVFEAAQRALRTGQPDEIEVSIHRADSSTGWILVRGRADTDDSGHITGLHGIAIDITERRRTEQTLRESEERFRLAEEAAKVGSFERDMQTGEGYWSPLTESMYGLQPGTGPQSMGAFLDLVHPEDRKQVEHLLAESVDHGVAEGEWRVVWPDGSVHWIAGRWRIFKDEQGRPLRAVGMDYDITERKQAEESLTLFRTLIDQSNDAIEVVDPDTLRFLDINGKACEDLGYSRGEILSMRVYDIDANIDQFQAAKIVDELRVTGSVMFESLHRRKDGSTFPVEVSVKLVQLDRAFLLAVARDITERKRAEQTAQEWQRRLELAEKSGLRIGLWDWDIVSNTVVWSDETYRQWGYTREGFSGKVEDVIVRIHPEDRPAVQEAILRVVGGMPEFAAQYRVVRPDGTVCWIDARGVAVNNGSPHILGIGIDITKQKSNERSLQDAKLELARVARVATLGELTTSIAHEINQPLAALVTNASASLRWLAAQPPNLHEARQAVAHVVREAHRASDVIAKVRALLVNVSPQMEPLYVNEVIRDVLSLLQSELVEGAVIVTTKLDADMPTVLGDRVQLQQVMVNLVMNAIDAMSAISGRARTLIIRSAKNAEGVLIQVQDSGKGLDPDQLPRIFDSFFTTKPQGIGMGLSISRSIVEAHGGRLWAMPASPYGAVFQLILPKAEVIK